MEFPIAFSAAELEKFAYCPLTWWLSRGGADEEGEEIQAGQQKHEEVGQEIASIEVDERHARESETTVLYFAVASTIIALLGVTFLQGVDTELTLIVNILSLIWMLAAVFFLFKAETLATPGDRLVAERVMLGFAMVATILAALSVGLSAFPDPIFARVAEVAALLWLVGASFFLSRSLRAVAKAALMKAKHAVKRVDYVDIAQSRPKLLKSSKYLLRGRPDYVLVEGEHHIPVELKTGRTPRGPLFSHIVQVSAYCLLVEEEYGKAPTHGVIRYPDASFDIEYGEDQRRLVLQKMEEMRGALRKGEAHRNHNRPGKCAGCSRRSVCPERLDKAPAGE